MPGPIGEQYIAVSTGGATSVTESSAILNGYLESLGPYSTVLVWFELSNGQTTGQQAMSAPGSFSARVSSLSSGTTYSFRAVAMSTLIGGQKADGSYMDFTTQHTVPQAPIEVSTSSASDVTSTSAVLRGYLSGMGPYTTVTVSFNWGNNTALGNTTGSQVLYGPGPFSIPVSGLAPNATYYFRAVARPDVVGVSPSYGSISSFSTSGGGTLSVSTGAPSNVTSSSASITGYLDSLGGYRNAYVWFEWGPTTSYGQTTAMQTLYSPDTFSMSLQGLNSGTLYHYRALAVPSAAGAPTVHGFDATFTTTSSPGVRVSTTSASNVSAKTATFNGYLTSTGSSNSVYVWFEYGTDTTFGNSTPRQVVNMPGGFNYSIGTLQPGLTYYYRAAAFANGVNTYGQYSTFQTAGGAPVNIMTNAASNISANAATLNAYINSLGNVSSIQFWFNWGPSPSYGKITEYQTVTAAQAVSAQITDLTAGLNYYYQAMAQTPDGTKIYGSQQIFSTVAKSSISVTTSPVSAVTSSTAVLNGVLNNLGNTSKVQVWFEYGTTADYGNSTELQTLYNPGTFSSAVTGLAPSRTYYYRAVALNPTAGGKSVNGAATMFTTSGGGPGPGPSPSPIPDIPPFVWLIMGGFLVIIIILIILLAGRR